MADRFTTLDVARTGTRLNVRLNRSEVRNAFDDTMIRELTSVFLEAAGDAELRCLILEGAGPVFCAGADLNWMRRAAAYGKNENLEDARRLAGLFAAFVSVPFTTVAVVKGAALGGGAGLVAAADIALVATDAKLGFTEVRLGIVPAVISSFVLRKVAARDARRYFVTGEIFDGARAASMGLASEALPPESLGPRLEEIVKQVQSVGPLAARAAKKLVEDVAARPYPDAVEDTSRTIAELRTTDEAREGMSAFLEKEGPLLAEDRALMFKRILIANRGEIACRIISDG